MHAGMSESELLDEVKGYVKEYVENWSKAVSGVILNRRYGTRCKKVTGKTLFGLLKEHPDVFMLVANEAGGTNIVYIGE